MDGPDSAAQLLVALRTTRTPPASPRRVSAGGDAQHPAPRGHPMTGLVHPHELEDFARTEPVSRANQTVAFAHILQSFVADASGRRRRIPLPAGALGNGDRAEIQITVDRTFVRLINSEWRKHRSM